jgi:ankyrin repeat protein
MVKYLASVGARTDIPGTTGLTPLHWAAGWGNLETVRALIELGADPGARNAFDQTAASVASLHGRHDVAAYLNGLKR